MQNDCEFTSAAILSDTIDGMRIVTDTFPFDVVCVCVSDLEAQYKPSLTAYLLGDYAHFVLYCDYSIHSISSSENQWGNVQFGTKQDFMKEIQSN